MLSRFSFGSPSRGRNHLTDGGQGWGNWFGQAPQPVENYWYKFWPPNIYTRLNSLWQELCRCGPHSRQQRPRKEHGDTSGESPLSFTLVSPCSWLSLSLCSCSVCCCCCCCCVVCCCCKPSELQLPAITKLNKCWVRGTWDFLETLKSFTDTTGHPSPTPWLSFKFP